MASEHFEALPYPAITPCSSRPRVQHSTESGNVLGEGEHGTSTPGLPEEDTAQSSDRIYGLGGAPRGTKAAIKGDDVGDQGRRDGGEFKKGDIRPMSFFVSALLVKLAKFFTFSSSSTTTEHANAVKEEEEENTIRIQSVRIRIALPGVVTILAKRRRA